jgi:hypothetical protein
MAKIVDSLSSFSSPISPNASPPPYEVGTRERQGGGDTLPLDDLTALRDLKSQMLTIAKILADSVVQAIDEAPLGQRVAALTQLTDRIMKLAAQLPGEEVEYVLSDDVEEVDD